mgnify:CR=1 FL=1
MHWGLTPKKVVVKLLKKLLLLGIIGELMVFGYLLLQSSSIKQLSSVASEKVEPVLNPSSSRLLSIDSFFDENSISDDQDKQLTSVEQIKTVYREAMEDLEEQVNAELLLLGEQAFRKFKKLQDDNKSFEVIQLFTKYSQNLKALEKETDESFQNLYEALQNELSVNGYDTSIAVDLKAEYEAKKTNRMNLLIETTIQQFGNSTTDIDIEKF